VSDLQKALFVSRRSLEHRFTQALGRTPAVEIRRARLEHVRRLLIETDLPLAPSPNARAINI
jgi:LacI family transcriptional regulator